MCNVPNVDWDAPVKKVNNGDTAQCALGGDWGRRESDGGDKLKIRKERHYLFAQRSVDTITTAFVHFLSFSKSSP